MRLKTLGGVKLEGAVLKAELPLALLAFIALKGSVSRVEVMELFWPFQASKTKRIKSLSDCLNRLNKLEPFLVRKADGLLSSSVELDVFLLEDAFSNKKFTQVMALYKGVFLWGVEDTKRWQLGEEFLEWLADKRCFYQGVFTSACLELLSLRLLKGELSEVRDLTECLLSLPFGVRVLSVDELQRLREACQAAGFVDLLARVDALVLAYHDFSEHLGSAPVLSSALVGRAELLEDLSWLSLQGERFVVLWGLGGVGKTVLARAVLSRLSAAFDDVLFVSLESLSQLSVEADVLLELQRILDLSSQEKRAIFAAVGKRKLLIAFDNCEALTHFDGFFSELLKACPRVQVLLTSRVQFSAGHHIELLPLAVRSEALVLLKQELIRLGLDAKSFSEVLLLDLCECVGGLPLALKLAASWLTSYPLAELLVRLKQDLNVLSISAERHGSILNVLTVSVNLLAPSQKAAFFALGVFEAGFSFKAAERVAGVSAFELKALVASSLLQFDVVSNRYGVHPLVASFIEGQSLAFEQAHAEYYLDLLSLEDASWLLDDLANLEKAWVYAVKAEWFELLCESLLDLRRVSDELGLAWFALRLCESLPSGLPALFEGRLFACRAWLSLRHGAYDKIDHFANHALGLLEDDVSALLALNALGGMHDLSGEFDTAKQYFLRSAERSTTIKDKGSAYLNLCLNALHTGELDDAEAYLQTVQEPSDRKQYLNAWLWLARSEPLKAIVVLEELLASTPESSHWHLQLQPKLAEAYLCLADFEMTDSLCTRALKLAKQRASIMTQAALLQMMGDVYYRQGKASEAAEWYSSSLGLVINSSAQPVVLARLVRLLLTRVLPKAFEQQLHTFCVEHKAVMFCSDRQLFATFALSVSDDLEVGVYAALSFKEISHLLLNQVKRLRGASAPL